jgi:ribonuclease BN (tRNA processing enzyme)/Flp pilus assembly protein TadD
MNFKKYKRIKNRIWDFNDHIIELQVLQSELNNQDVILKRLISADLLYMNGEYSEARNIYYDLGEKFSDNNFVACSVLNMMVFDRKKDILDNKFYKQIMKNKSIMETRTLLSIYISLGKKDMFKKVLRLYKSYKQDSYKVDFYEGSLYMLEGKNDEGIEKYLEAIKSGIKFVGFFNNISILYRKKNNLAKAIEYLNKALKINHNSYNVNYNLGVYYKLRKDYKNAIKFFEKVNIYTPNREVVQRNLIELYREFDDKDVTSFIEEERKKYESYYLDREIIVQKYAYDDMELSIDILKKFCKKYKERDDSWYVSGLILMYTNKKNDSIDFFSNCLKVSKRKSFYYDKIAGYYFGNVEHKYYLELIENAFNETSQIRYLKNSIEKLSSIDEYKLIESLLSKLLPSNNKNIEFLKTYVSYLSGLNKHTEVINLINSLESRELITEMLDNLILSNYNKGEYKCVQNTLNEYKYKKNDSIQIDYYFFLSRYKLEDFSVLQEVIDYEIKEPNTEYEKKIEEFKKFADEEIHRKTDIRLNRILKKTKEILEHSKIQQKEFNHFLIKKEEPKKELYFECLRRWNSYTPILGRKKNESLGGGYFLNLNGKGIVVDPGLDFLDNFKNIGHLFDEIDQVYLTHAHNDHTADLESILTLLFKHNQLYNSEETLNQTYIRSEQDRNVNSDINPFHYKESDTGKSLFNHITKQGKEIGTGHKKILEFFMSRSVFKKYVGMFDLMKSTNYKVNIVDENSTINIVDSLDNLEAQITFFECKHFDVISDYSTFGMTICTNDTRLIYSADTGISKNLISNIEKSVKMNHFTDFKNNILLAHIGGFKDFEDHYNLDNFENSYKGHLGRVGLFYLVDYFLPNICLISEFGEEYRGHRISITQAFQNEFSNVKFVPCDIGLKIKLNSDLETHSITDIDNSKETAKLVIEDIPLKHVNFITTRNEQIRYYDLRQKRPYFCQDLIAID